MELELKKACLDAYETGGELVLTQEETAETIVPDYCPDIARVIETEGKVYIHSRELRDGKAEVSGTVRVTVLYTPCLLYTSSDYRTDQHLPYHGGAYCRGFSRGRRESGGAPLDAGMPAALRNRRPGARGGFSKRKLLYSGPGCKAFCYGLRNQAGRTDAGCMRRAGR